MKSKLKSFLSILLLASFVLTPIGRSISYASDNSNINQNDNRYFASDAELNDEDLKYLNKVVSVSKFYYFDDNILKISLTKDQLMNEYGFTEKDYQTLSETVLNKEVNLDEKDNKPVVTPYASVSNGTLYISHSDLQGGAFAVLSAASSAGPAAMYSALLSISTALSGPVGSIITTIVSLLAAPSLTELCVRVTYAVATNQGIYIKPVASYPPLDIGYY